MLAWHQEIFPHELLTSPTRPPASTYHGNVEVRPLHEVRQ